MADEKPIIIIKKKGGHGGHHGGAWKVAYADFVTAMMAFFMVMWLLNTAEVTTKQNIASYFRRPGLFQSGSGTPLLIGEAGILEDAYVPPHPSDMKNSKGKGEQEPGKIQTTDEVEKKNKDQEDIKKEGIPDIPDKGQGLKKEKVPGVIKPSQGEGASQGQGQGQAKAIETKQMEQLAKEIKQEMARIPDMKKLLGDLQVKVEPDGLVIEILDTDQSSMFRSGSAQILSDANPAFAKIAELLGKFPNKIDVIGHTDSKPFSARPGGYGNWELSADRANAARRLLSQSGIAEDRLLSVVGRSDRDLKVKNDPLAAANRRITLKMRYTTDEPVDLSNVPSALDILNSHPEQSSDVTGVSPTATGKPTPFVEGRIPWRKDRGEGPGDGETKATGKKKDTVPLPPYQNPSDNPTFIEKDKIFGDKPVIGPATPFSDM